MSTLQEFCGLQKNESYEIFDKDKNTFGRCFLWTAISYPAFIFLSVVPAYLLGSTQQLTSKRKSYPALLCGIITCLLALCNLIETISNYAIHSRDRQPFAYLLSKVLSFISWVICSMLQWKETAITNRKKKNNICVLFPLFFVLLSVSMQLQIVVENMHRYSIDTIPVDFVGVIVEFALSVSFLVACIAVQCSKTLGTKYLQEDVIELGQAEVSTNVLSNLVYWWSNQLLQKGYRQQLKSPDNLFLLPKSLKTRDMKLRLQNELQLEKNRIERNGSGKERNRSFNIPLLKVLNRCYGKVFYSLGLLKLMTSILLLVQPTLVNYLVSFISNKNEPLTNGYYYALGFLATTLLHVLFELHYKYHTDKVELQVRASLISAIYEKTFAVKPCSFSKFSVGKVVNLIGIDTDRVRMFCNRFHEVWGIPLQIIVCLVLLYGQVGVAFLPAIIYCVLLVPFAQRLSKKMFGYQVAMMVERDKRIKIMCEILFGIRIIKYNAWENIFKKSIDDVRNPALRINQNLRNLDAVVCIIWGMSIPIIALLIFGTHVLLGNDLDAATAFTCMALINQLVDPLNSFSWDLNTVLDAWVSLKRIEKYLNLPETTMDDFYSSDATETLLSKNAMKLENGIFSWNEKKSEEIATKKKRQGCCGKRKKKTSIVIPNIAENVKLFELSHLSLSIPKGKFIGITGKVGAGKSSLFASITANMEKHDGFVYICKKDISFAFCSQVIPGPLFMEFPNSNDNGLGFNEDPWIQHLSIRDNILFGSEYDEEKYKDVIYACALVQDLKLFPAGDHTEIGENGVNLSGGQKARVALARAVYQDKDIYLLDDPIAAVDAHVAKHIYKYCIMGLLKDKTRVLCTHHTNYLHQSDHIVMLNDGIIEKQGAPGDVLKDIDIKSIEMATDKEDEEKEKAKKEEEDLKRRASQGKLVTEEESEEGAISFKVVKRFWKSFGNVFATIVIFTKICEQAAQSTQNWWLSYWVENEGGLTNTTAVIGEEFDSNNDAMYYLSIYGYILIGYVLFIAMNVFTMGYGCVHAAKNLHNELLDAVLETTISFLDVTPIGRIINRFSSDIGDIDDELAFLFSWFMRELSVLVGTVVLVCYSLPLFTTFLVPLALVYYFIQRSYRRTSRDLKRIGAVACSPILEHFTETLNGNAVIRAFRDFDRFIAENENILDRSQRAEYNGKLAVIWLDLRLNMISVVMVTAVSFLAVLEHGNDGSSAGLVGLAITSAVQVTPILSRLLTSFTEAEKQMVRVERVTQYIDEIPRENAMLGKVSKDWPNVGKVNFSNVSFQYREHQPFALKDVTFEINGGEKVGICGRTGSGKSTLLKVLFNVVELTSGHVQIDGVKIDEIHYSILRSRMSIIPQDPFLFDGTVARNLDPTESFSSEEMLDVVRKCHLEKLVKDLGGLEGNVGAKGSNLSAGQKQLLCLARALLKKSKIICIDEATASVDLETDKLIQETIREEFFENTVLTIAHRMNTIIDSDRVLVVEKGKVCEFDTPSKLLADSTSEFYALVNQVEQTKKTPATSLADIHSSVNINININIVPRS